MSESRVVRDEAEASWLKEWETNSSLREEFSDNLDRWLAFCRADANGQIKFFKR
jgi:hypothetical protein